MYRKAKDSDPRLPEAVKHYVPVPADASNMDGARQSLRILINLNKIL